MPSTHQRSGRFESCSSNRSSPVAASTSLISAFTSGSQASSSLSVGCRPRSLSRSLRLTEMFGMASGQYCTRLERIISRSAEKRSRMSWISSATIAMRSRPRPQAITGTSTFSGSRTSGRKRPAPPSSIQPRRGWRTCTSTDGCALATEHQAARPHAVEGVTPTARSRVAAVLMHGGDLGEERLGNRGGGARVLDEVHVVGLAGRVELRHEEGVHVPELVFDQPAAHLLEPHAHELDFDQIEELPVGMLLAGRDAGRFEGDRILAKAPLAPAPVLQHLGSQAGGFFPHAFLPDLERHRVSEFL